MSHGEVISERPSVARARPIGLDPRQQTIPGLLVVHVARAAQPVGDGVDRGHRAHARVICGLGDHDPAAQRPAKQSDPRGVDVLARDQPVDRRPDVLHPVLRSQAASLALAGPEPAVIERQHRVPQRRERASEPLGMQHLEPQIARRGDQHRVRSARAVVGEVQVGVDPAALAEERKRPDGRGRLGWGGAARSSRPLHRPGVRVQLVAGDRVMVELDPDPGSVAEQDLTVLEPAAASPR